MGRTQPLLATLLLLVPLACASTGQLGLFGDRECTMSPDVSIYACAEHDNCYAFGGTEQDRHVCDAEFLADMLIDDVEMEIAWTYYKVVHHAGKSRFRYQATRTRGPPR